MGCSNSNCDCHKNIKETDTATCKVCGKVTVACAVANSAHLSETGNYFFVLPNCCDIEPSIVESDIDRFKGINCERCARDGRVAPATNYIYGDYLCQPCLRICYHGEIPGLFRPTRFI